MRKSFLGLFLLTMGGLAVGCAEPVGQAVPYRSTPPQALRQAKPTPARALVVEPVRAGRPAVAHTPSVGQVPASWVPHTRARQWRYIVIHHSATANGCAADFDKAHKGKGWDELGYHFVIGNGHGSGDGLVEVGPRWAKQKWGAHAKTPDNRFNDHGIGICLVGNFQNGQPTPRQLAALTKLTAYLMDAHSIPASRVIGHNDAKATACPGRNMSVALVRNRAARILASTGTPAVPLENRPAVAHGR